MTLALGSFNALIDALNRRLKPATMMRSTATTEKFPTLMHNMIWRFTLPPTQGNDSPTALWRLPCCALRPTTSGAGRQTTRARLTVALDAIRGHVAETTKAKGCLDASAAAWRGAVEPFALVQRATSDLNLGHPPQVQRHADELSLRLCPMQARHAELSELQDIIDPAVRWFG